MLLPMAAGRIAAQSTADMPSVAGLFPINDCGRKVWDFNLDWRYHCGDVQGAEAVAFDDTKWDVVAVPHTVQLMPAEGSGCRNYQGVVWYRKHFSLDTTLKGKKLFLHFEAIMGKRNELLRDAQFVDEYKGKPFVKIYKENDNTPEPSKEDKKEKNEIIEEPVALITPSEEEIKASVENIVPEEKVEEVVEAVEEKIDEVAEEVKSEITEEVTNN